MCRAVWLFSLPSWHAVAAAACAQELDVCCVVFVWPIRPALRPFVVTCCSCDVRVPAWVACGWARGPWVYGTITRACGGGLAHAAVAHVTRVLQWRRKWGALQAHQPTWFEPLLRPYKYQSPLTHMSACVRVHVCVRSCVQPERGVFAVTLLDSNDNPSGKGELHVDPEDLELISPSKNLKWKLKFLRRFGYEKTYFSFEAGRRCGEEAKGIFAFRTPQVLCMHACLSP